MPPFDEGCYRHQDAEEVEDSRQVSMIEERSDTEFARILQALLEAEEHQFGVDPYEHQPKDDPHEGWDIEERLPDRYEHQR